MNNLRVGTEDKVMGHGTFCCKIVGLQHKIPLKYWVITHFLYVYEKNKKQFFSVKLLDHHTHILGIFRWTIVKGRIRKNLLGHDTFFFKRKNVLQLYYKQVSIYEWSLWARDLRAGS